MLPIPGLLLLLPIFLAADTTRSAVGEPPGQLRDPLVPDLVLSPPGGPRIVLFSTPGERGVALRLSIPLEEAEGDAGWGWLLQELALERVAGSAARVGARLQVRRTPWSLAYLATGAVQELDHLGWLLRMAVEEPGGEGLQTVLARARGRLDSEAETADGRLAERLRSGLPGAHPPLWGTQESLSRVTPGFLRDHWARTHQRSQMTLVVVGDVTIETLLPLLRGVGAPEAARAGPLDLPAVSVPMPSRPPPLRSWYAEAGYVSDPEDPAVALVMRVLERQLGEIGVQGEARLEGWPLPNGHALVVRVVGTPGRESTLRSAVGGLWLRAAETFARSEMEGLRNLLLLELLESVATPWGLAEREGWHLEAAERAGGGVTGAVGAYRSRLEALSWDEVSDLLLRLARDARITAELQP